MAQLPDIIAAYYRQLKDRRLNELVSAMIWVGGYCGGQQQQQPCSNRIQRLFD